jgi:hypothetical protein
MNMTTNVTEPQADGGPEGGAAPPAGGKGDSAWNRFWFTPADPTALGLMRICCGLVVFYTFVVYTFDLQALLGKHAWQDLEMRQRWYREWPVAPGPLGWYGPPLLPRPQQQGWEQSYWDSYNEKWHTPPPPPWPRDRDEAWRIDEYRVRWGEDPRLVTHQGVPLWSIWFHVTDPDAMMAVQAVILVVTFLFLIGFCTRVTSALTWFAALCYIHRAQASLFGVDTMMTILLLYLMLGPSGAALSVDRLLARWWARARPRVVGRWRAFRGKGAQAAAPAAPGVYSPTPTPSVSAGLVLRLMQVHVCIIYGSAGLAKLQGTSWWTGIAVWGTVANFEFAPVQYGWYIELLRLLGSEQWLFQLTMTLASAFTLFFEVGYPFLIWRPRTRWVMLWMAIILHGFIGLFMGLKTFSLLMLVMNLAFVPPETVRAVLRRLTGGRYGQTAPAEPAPEASRPVPVPAARPEKEPQKVPGHHVRRRR